MYCTALPKEHLRKGQVWFHGTALCLGLSKVDYILSKLLPLFTAVHLWPFLWSEGAWLVLHELTEGWPQPAWGASQPHSWRPHHPPTPQCTGALSQHITHWHTPHSISLPAGQLHFLQKTLWENEHHSITRSELFKYAQFCWAKPLGFYSSIQALLSWDFARIARKHWLYIFQSKPL